MTDLKTISEEYEWRQATVMFADISGFTAMSEKLDPEEITAIMDECFELMGSIITQHEGTIDKFIGDCVMALFGIPTAIEQAAEKAVKSALSLQNALYQYNLDKHLLKPLDIHIGISSGKMILGPIGGCKKREHTVIGDRVTLAAILEDISPKGHIYVCDETFHQTKQTFDYREQIPVPFKEHLVPVFELTSLQPNVYPAQFVIPVPAQSEAYRESERRQVTVMFADIRGLTDIPVEEALPLIHDCFCRMEAIIDYYGGSIDKFIGHVIMGLFGAPVAVENASQKAVNTAIEMRNTVFQLRQEKQIKIPLDIRIGINTGMVIAGVIGSYGKKAYTVMGDTVNTAARLETAAAYGQIFVGRTTYTYTKEQFDYQPMQPTMLQGKTDPVPVFELVSENARIHKAKLGPERMIFSEMIGREPALEALHHHLRKVINGEGSIVSVIGEAGIGKSRLLAELLKKEEIKDVRVLQGRAVSLGENLGFHPIIDLIRTWAGIEENDNSSEEMEKLERAIYQIDPEGAAEIFPFIATLMGMKLYDDYAERVNGIEGEALEKLILNNLREFITKLSRQTPVMFIIENLHWADQTSLELLERLYRLVKDHRIFFINILRPNYPKTGNRVLTVLREKYADYHIEISLEALNDQQSALLIHHLLSIEGLPPTLKTRIIQRAGGNPFFIEEVMRSLLDEGAVEVKNGAFSLTERIESVVIPETIHDVLMARIDRLEEKTRHLLKVASVIGRYFFYRILMNVAQGIEEIEGKLHYLEDIQLLQERQRLAELEYFFKHALTQEVTYDSILLKRRKELHVQIAAAIECIFCDRLSDFYDMLALHYNQGEHLVLHYDFKISSVMNSPGFSLGISRHRQPFPPEQRIFFLQNLWDPI